MFQKTTYNTGVFKKLKVSFLDVVNVNMKMNLLHLKREHSPAVYVLSLLKPN